MEVLDCFKALKKSIYHPILFFLIFLTGVMDKNSNGESKDNYCDNG